MIRTMAIGAAVAAIAVTVPAKAANYSLSYQARAGLLADRLGSALAGSGNVDAARAIPARPTGGMARPAPHQRINLHGLLGVTSAALRDRSLPNDCTAGQADCNDVGFAVVAGLAPLDGIGFTSASDIFATTLLKSRSKATIARVPEPATWALWIAGFGTLGLMQRRQVPRTT